MIFFCFCMIQTWLEYRKQMNEEFRYKEIEPQLSLIPR